jgi:hypothetical protein
MALEKVVFTVVVEAVIGGQLQISEPASFTLAGVVVIAETVTGPDGAPVLRVRAGPPSRQGFARFEKTFMALATFKLYRNNQPLQSVEVRNMFNAITLDLSNQA